jgi:uncharacterized protein
MRWWIFLLLFILPAGISAAPVFPALTGRVVDQARILDAATRQRLEEQLASYEKTSGNQIVVVTLSSLQGLPIEDYGYRLGRHWGIGQKDRDSGALLIVVPSERQTRIEVGYGLEGELTDAASRMIIEQAMLPRFRKGDYAGGIEEGVTAMLTVLGGNSAQPASAIARGDSGNGSGWGLLLPFLFLFLLLRSLGRRRSGLIAPLVLGSMLNMRGGGWGSGSGGFRGGGGSFGGGGASGRW